MLHYLMLLYLLVLFMVFVPGQLYTVPLHNHNLVNLVHALLFVLVWHVTHKFVWGKFYGPKGGSVMSESS